MTDGSNRPAAVRLRDYVDDLEVLLQRRAEINEQIKSKKGAAKAEGFVPKAIMQIIKEREVGPAIMREWNGLMAVYRAGMGMLGGDSLPDSARKRLDDDTPEGEDQATDQPQDLDREIDQEEIQRAYEEGAQAARDGQKVTDNPYPAGDPRRAAWDEGWCGAKGGTGMEIPKAFQRKTDKKKKGGDGAEPDADGKGADA